LRRLHFARRACLEASRDINGPLLVALAIAIRYHDIACVETLRSGAPLVNGLPFAGNGKRITADEHMTEAQLQQEWAETNAKMLERCKEDCHADKLLQACKDDWRKHRMTEPRKLEMADLVHGSFSPRFSIEQGEVFPLVGFPRGGPV